MNKSHSLSPGAFGWTYRCHPGSPWPRGQGAVDLVPMAVHHAVASDQKNVGNHWILSLFFMNLSCFCYSNGFEPFSPSKSWFYMIVLGVEWNKTWLFSGLFLGPKRFLGRRSMFAATRSLDTLVTPHHNGRSWMFMPQSQLHGPKWHRLVITISTTNVYMGCIKCIIGTMVIEMS